MVFLCLLVLRTGEMRTQLSIPTNIHDNTMKIIRTLFVTIIVASLPDSVATAQQDELEIPSIFGWNFDERHCENNGVVSSWCDETIQPTLKCALNPDFN
jgi:hypothetical protein